MSYVDIKKARAEKSTLASQHHGELGSCRWNFVKVPMLPDDAGFQKIERRSKSISYKVLGVGGYPFFVELRQFAKVLGQEGGEAADVVPSHCD
jgi:hypothetical protein